MLTGLTKFSSKTCIRAESQTFAQEFYLNSFKTSKVWHWCLSVNYSQVKIT